jgi:2-beta-glucuronyltransferase
MLNSVSKPKSSYRTPAVCGVGDVRNSVQCRGTAVIFTQQFVGLGTRKTSIVFWAEKLAERGWDTRVVTTQLSLLSVAARVPRLRSVPRSDINVWRTRGERLEGYIWVPPLHPAKLGPNILDRAAEPLFRLFPHFLPSAVRKVVSEAAIIVIESCAAVALFDLVRCLAPQAKIIYCGNDRLAAIDMHPMLSTILRDTAKRYDLIRVPSQAMVDDFPEDVHAVVIPQGIDKDAFEHSPPSPYRGPEPNVILAGDGAFDRTALQIMVDHFPRVAFHAFGRMDLGALKGRANVVHHGEVPHATLVPYIIHADVGAFVPMDIPQFHYLAEASNKLLQYTYCRLPIVAPNFATSNKTHIFGYDTRKPETIVEALRRALESDHSIVDTTGVHDWSSIIGRVLQAVDLE